MPEGNQNIVVRVHESHKIRNTLAGFGILAAGYVGLHGVGLDLPWPDVPNAPELAMPRGEPEHAEATVRQDLMEVPVEMDFLVTDKVRTGVEVEATAEGYRVPVLGNLGGALGDGHVNKIFYGDYLIGNDRSKNTRLINEEHKVTTVTSPDGTVVKTDEFVRVTLRRPLLEVVQPRIDMLAPENCVELRPGDSKLEIDKKIAEYNEKVITGKKPECDYDFNVSGAIAPGDVADAYPIALAAAQLALALDARVDGADSKIQDAQERIEKEFYDKVVAKYPGIKVEYLDNQQVIDPVDALKDRFTALSTDITKRFPKIEFKKGKKDRLELIAEGPGGEKATVRFAGDVSKISSEQIAELNGIVARVKAEQATATTK